MIQGAVTVPGDDHDSVYLLGIDSRGLLYTSLDRGLALTDANVLAFFEPAPQYYGINYPYVAIPSAGPISGGTAVTIRDNYPGLPIVYFADKTATITAADSSGIHVISPTGDRPGPVDVTIKYSDGYVAYIAEGFSYGPAIEYLDRDAGSTAGGDSLILFALGMPASATGVQVLIGGAPATINSVAGIGMSPMKSPTYEVKLTTPSGNAGPADVVLTTQDGSATLKAGFNYVPITNLGGQTAITQMVYDSTRGLLFRCDYGSNRVEVLDTATRQFVRQYSTHLGPIAMALSPDHGTLYVTTSERFVDVIDVNSGAQHSIQPSLAGLAMSRIGVTSKGTLFVGMYNPAVVYDSRLVEVDPGSGSSTTRLSNFNGNYLEIGVSRDGTHAFISSDLDVRSSGNRLYYWDSFTDTFRQQFVPGWSDYSVDDDASLFLGGRQTYDPIFDIHNTFQSFDYDDGISDGLVWGEKLDDSGAVAIRPSLHSLTVYDVHRGNRITRIALPSQTMVTLDAMSVDSAHGIAYISSTAGLLQVSFPNVLAIGRIEPAQGLTSGGQRMVVRGIGFQQHATVTIGGQPAATVFSDSTTLQVTAPALPLGTAAVQVTNDDGRSYTWPGAYSAVNSQPIIAGTSPSQLRISGGFSFLPISIVGMNFSPGAVALWNGSPRFTYVVDDTELYVDLNPADNASPGAANLAVRNTDGALSNQVTVPIKDYPHVSLPDSFSFAAQVVNTSAPIQTGTVTNSGTDPVTLLFSTETPFTLTTNCPPIIAAGASCALSVGFSPTAAGIYSSAITVRGDVSANVGLSGVAGLAAATLSALPARVSFPGTSSQSVASVIITNLGLPNLAINDVSTDSGEFSKIFYGGSSLITGQTALINVTFRPMTGGTHTGNLVIDSTAGRTVVPLTVTVLLVLQRPPRPQRTKTQVAAPGGSMPMESEAPAADVSPAKYSRSIRGGAFMPSGQVGFDSTYVGTASASKTLPLAHVALDSSGAVNIEVTGDFEQTLDCESHEGDFTNCSAIIRFVPKAEGARTGILRVKTQQGVEGYVLSGAGVR